jgi:hypothetical protein
MTEERTALTIETVLLCDDVRKEITGKDIVIGVYGEDATVAAFPVTLAFSLYMRVRFPGEGPFLTEFRVIGPSGQPLTPTVKVPMRAREGGGMATVQIGQIPIQVQSAGQVQFQWRPPEGEWDTIQKLNIKQGELNFGEAINIVRRPDI